MDNLGSILMANTDRTMPVRAKRPSPDPEIPVLIRLPALAQIKSADPQLADVAAMVHQATHVADQGSRSRVSEEDMGSSTAAPETIRNTATVDPTDADAETKDRAKPRPDVLAPFQHAATLWSRVGNWWGGGAGRFVIGGTVVVIVLVLAATMQRLNTDEEAANPQAETNDLQLHRVITPRLNNQRSPQQQDMAKPGDITVPPGSESWTWGDHHQATPPATANAQPGQAAPSRPMQPRGTSSYPSTGTNQYEEISRLQNPTNGQYRTTDSSKP